MPFSIDAYFEQSQYESGQTANLCFTVSSNSTNYGFIVYQLPSGTELGRRSGQVGFQCIGIGPLSSTGTLSVRIDVTTAAGATTSDTASTTVVGPSVHSVYAYFEYDEYYYGEDYYATVCWEADPSNVEYYAEVILSGQVIASGYTAGFDCYLDVPIDGPGTLTVTIRVTAGGISISDTTSTYVTY